MIGVLLRTYFLNLRRDRPAQTLTFIVPMAFFTIFALVFGGRHDVTGRVRVAVVDEAHSPASARLLAALQRESGLRVRSSAPASHDDTTKVALTRARAEALVREGEVPVAIVIPAGIDSSLGRFDGGGRAITLLSDPSDPVAPQIVTGLLQKVVMIALPSALAKGGIAEFDRYAGGLTPRQRQAVDQWMRGIDSSSAADAPRSGARGDRDSAGTALTGLARIETFEVLGRKQDTSMISFYVAGIGVMFLLFACSSGAGALLEEVDSGTLERVLSSHVGMNGLLAGKWTYLTLLGVLQLTVMCVYAMLAFRLDLMRHLPGFAVMTVVTAATAAAFGLVLATMSRTRQQLGSISTLLILTLSAFGGSMFPRFLMSDAMQRAGLLTFNAWALDGYVKVFWRDARVVDLWPQVGVLLAFMLVFLALARWLARRWESA
jgi:ABC-2 type transport system permease protein